jgi:hypothetical protein
MYVENVKSTEQKRPEGQKTMTVEQRSELEKAIERAERKGVHIVGRGALKSGTRYFIVSGYTAQCNHDHTLHYVRIEGLRLVCDCTADHYQRNGVICTHRAVCHVELARELAAAKAAQVLAAKMAEARERAEAAATYRDMLNDDYPPFAA